MGAQPLPKAGILPTILSLQADNRELRKRNTCGIYRFSGEWKTKLSIYDNVLFRLPGHFGKVSYAIHRK